MDVKSEIEDDDSDNLEDAEDAEEDVNIEDEDFSQFGIAVGEELLRKFYSTRRPTQLPQSRNASNKASAPSSAVKRDGTDSLFRPTTPSLKNSFNQRKQTPV